jgi:hypothetical protein
MPKKQRKFADDGWAVWIDGEDTSTIHINDWLNPKGKSFIDIAIHIRGIKSSKSLNVYVPFSVSKEEVEDVSLTFSDTRILQAIFSAACIVDYKKNPHTSEIAFNGKTIDVVHISTIGFQAEPLPSGTLIRVDLQELQPYLDNDEAYFIWRMPHKSLDAIFKPYVDVGNVLERLRDLITTPVVSEKYGYSIRINEPRLLPEEITRIGMFHRQKLKKAAIMISVDEKYELNDAGCYRIRRLEENLYRDYLPKDYRCDDVITYQWIQSWGEKLRGQFNFYYSIARNSVSHRSLMLYVVLLLSVGVIGNFITDLVRILIILLT